MSAPGAGSLLEVPERGTASMNPGSRNPTPSVCKRDLFSESRLLSSQLKY